MDTLVAFAEFIMTVAAFALLFCIMFIVLPILIHMLYLFIRVCVFHKMPAGIKLTPIERKEIYKHAEIVNRYWGKSYGLIIKTDDSEESLDVNKEMYDAFPTGTKCIMIIEKYINSDTGENEDFGMRRGLMTYESLQEMLASEFQEIREAGMAIKEKLDNATNGIKEMEEPCVKQ